MMVCASIASAQYTQLLGYTNQTWRYNETSTSALNPGATFMQPGFDDSVAGWKTGFPLFGNDDAGVYNGTDDPFRGGINGFVTPLDRTGGRVTFYFRTHINVPTLPNASAVLYSTNYLDDGAIYYINGVEIGRMRMPTGAVTWDTLGSNPPTEGIAYRIDFPPEAAQNLHVGDNVVAVEVHQSSTGSSDVAFAMNLILINPFAPVILDNTVPADVTVVENRPFTLVCKADASPPISYQWVHGSTDIPGATSDKYSVGRAQPGDAGDYHCRVTNPVASTDSRTAHVTYVQDNTPPTVLGAVAPNLTTVVVQFSEAMDVTTLIDTFSWALMDDQGAFLEIASINVSVGDSVATVVLGPSTPTLAENALYTVSLGDGAIFDLAGPSRPEGQRDNNTLAGTNITFRSYTTAGCNNFLMEAFDTSAVAGNTVSILTSSTNYPNRPQDVFRLASFDTRNGYSNDAHEQYGGRVRGLFVPPISGPWTFYLASDDNSELWINPSGPGSAGKQLVASELNCCNNFLPANDATTGARNPQTSLPINLTAGQAYYVEGLYKEGTGGDWLKVSARPSSEPVPTGGNSEAGSVSANVIQGGAGPVGILSGTTISSQPQSQNKISGQVAAFSVGLSPDVPGCYQWRTNGVDVPGAIGPSFNFVTDASQNGMKVRCAVTLMGGTSLLSSEATLNVIIDTIAPTVAAVGQDLIGNITVTFSEPVDMNAATNRNNYAVDGVTPASATQASPTSVLLEPGAPMAACPATHSLVAGNIRDLANNLISPNPSTVPFTLNNLLVLPINANKLWRYNDSGDELGNAWYATGYNDSAWSNGAPTLAFPGGEVITAGYPVRTTLAGVRLTTYFRTHFTLGSDPSSVTNLQLNVILDDGGIFYLNGQELTRIRMPAGPVDTNTITTAGSPSDPPQILETYNLSPGLLVNGDNVIAARVHQSATTSSDEVFAAGIFAQSTGCAAPRPRISISRNNNNVQITSTAPGGTIYKATSLAGPWTSVGAAPQTVAIGAGAGPLFFEIRP